MSEPHVPPIAATNGGPRRALVLAGGGMRVAYQAGVVRALADAGLRFHHVDGTSGGTMNTAMLLSGLSPAEACARWTSLDVKKFASFMPLKEYADPLHAQALGTADGIRRHVYPHLGIDVARMNAATGIEGTFNVCNYTRKTVEAWTHDRVDMDLLVAAISIPIFMPAVQKDGATYTDAMWIKDANLLEAVRRGAEELWLVWCIGNHARYLPGAFNQYIHMMEMSANGALFDELRQIDELNARIRAGERPHGLTRPVRLHVVRPEYPLPLDPDFFLGRITAATLVAMGHADAVRYLATMSPHGLPLTPEVTQMSTTTSPGIQFSEVMKGGFALGETDPEAGRARGAREGTQLAMHATVSVPDLDAFLADRDHTGTLVGSIDFASWGTGIPTGQGVFNLFKPGGADTKLMVYELPFQHGGESYYLAGVKRVKDDRGLDMWSDTTTLFTRLHRGTDATGEVVGAGVLTLGAGDFATVLKGIHVTGADGLGERAAAIARFGKFFSGELWDTYGIG
ncbi:MAG TPA: patatin-like phospholipase family protein [Longimicrobium sp.]|nr:patatin-like phospholipase family protein [Longimicrobium sp.]